MNRGSALAAAEVDNPLLASMRPRFMNRGSQVPELEFLVAGLASMRPRFMNRGSDGYRRRAPVAQRRFNEAPIHESGK